MIRFLINAVLAGCLLSLLSSIVRARPARIESGALWLDDQGVHVNAHGGGLLRHGERYYWHGEHKVAGSAGNKAHVGVHCYSSANLVDWKDEGIALSVVEEAGHEIEKGCILERPKVVYNPRTKTFVMWFHLEHQGQGYETARSGVAVSDAPAGPFKFLGSVRPNAGRYPVNMSAADRQKVDAYRASGDFSGRFQDMPALQIFARDFEGGQMARDMTLFVDDDGAAYHIFSSEENRSLHVAKLSEDWLSHSGEFARVLPAGRNEGPAIFKHEGRYNLITSGLTGWAPNPARSYVADSLYGPWTYLGNPCSGVNPLNGMGPELTFGGQSTFVLPVEGKEGTRFVAMFDLWRPKDAIDGRYLWLPIEMQADRFFVRWRDEWSLEDL